ncbi:MAG TPA: Fe-S protein assembly co-chaperone HscB [Gemmataceae bacterium]|nr:Fe-S protein assembly co-chaperone HscB [Gemmataceae bacterium]
MSELDHFQRLGLPRRFALDLREVERQYLARSRAIHPDFHQLGATSEQQASLDATARLNEAYAALRDPFKRAEYLLQLERGPTASEQKEMPPEFLEEVLELRMAIEELREVEPPDSLPRREMENRLEHRRAMMLQEVENDFAAMTPSNRKEALISIRRRLNAIKYMQGLLRDLRAQ